MDKLYKGEALVLIILSVLAFIDILTDWPGPIDWMASVYVVYYIARSILLYIKTKD